MTVHRQAHLRSHYELILLSVLLNRCTEIVAEEFEEPEDKWKKFGSLMAGVLIVGAITVVTEGWEH